MPSYRFCRPDDIPLLVRAVNCCYGVHFPGTPPLTIEAFRAEMKELDVWPSNSMVAVEGDTPIAVSIGTKRAAEVLVMRIGVDSAYQRRGHGGHLLTSLSQKLAVLGPERLIAEVPRALPGLAPFVESVGYRREATYTDYTRPPGPLEPVPEGLAMPITVDELSDNEVLATPSGVAWERSAETIRNCAHRLQGMAIASPLRIEAYLLYLEAGESLEVLAAHAVDPARRVLMLSLLFRALPAAAQRTVRLPRLAADEFPAPLLTNLGFLPGDRYDRYAAVATPA